MSSTDWRYSRYTSSFEEVRVVAALSQPALDLVGAAAGCSCAGARTRSSWARTYSQHVCPRGAGRQLDQEGDAAVGVLGM